jgi:hypothetical protein
MKSLIVGSLSVLLVSAATAPAVRAQTAAVNPTTLRTIVTTQLTPFNLVTLAHRGYFTEQGIPSYGSFTAAYHLGKITNFDLVRAAVKANRLDPESLNDKGYLSAVEAQLRGLENIY